MSKFSFTVARAALILISVGLSFGAHAQTWVMCDSCTSTGQFELAAMNKHGTERGDALYGVVNTATGRLQWVEVTYTPPGEDPWIVYPGGEVSATSAKGGVALSSSTSAFMPAGGDLVGATALAAQSGKTAYSVPASLRETEKVQAIVRVSKDQTLVTAPNNGYFPDFNTAFYDYPAILDQFIRTTLYANNPALAYSEIGGNLFSSLINAIELHFGKGPAGCVIFNNGESACFQINIMAPGALRFITGTRQDVNGNVIPESGGVPNAGNRGVTVKPSVGGGPVGYTPVGSGTSTWIMCGYVGGKLVSCYTEVF